MKTLSLIFLIIFSLPAKGSIRNRTFESPQHVVPTARLLPNTIGGYNYYVNGRKIGYSRKNISGSVDIYIMHRLKYRGVKFKTSKYHTFYGVGLAGSKTVKKAVRTGDKSKIVNKSERQRRDVKLQAWKVKAKAEQKSLPKTWDRFTPEWMKWEK